MNQAWTKYLPAFVRTKVEGRQYLQNVINNTGWLFADNILRMGVGLLVGVWVARYLGPEQYGLLNYALAFMALFSPVASLGLDGIVIRNIVRDPSSKNETLGTAFMLKLIGGFVTFLLTMGTIFLFRPGDGLTHWLVGILSVSMVFQAFDIIDFWYQSQVQSKYTVLAKNTAFLISSLIKIVLIISKAPLIAFAWMGLFEVASGSAGLVLAYKSKGGHLRAWRGSLEKAKGLLKDSWPLIFSNVVIMVYMRIDQVMLGEMTGNAEVGIYSAAVRIAEVWYFIPTTVVSSVFPSIVEAKAISEELFYERLQKLYNMMALMAYLVALPVTLLSGWLIETLFGQAFAKAGPMLALFIWAGLFTNLGVARSSFLTTMNWTKVHFMTVFIGCLINVTLNYMLIPRYGGMGAVIASCVAYWFAAHGACFLYKPLYKTGYMLTRAIFYPKVW